MNTPQWLGRNRARRDRFARAVDEGATHLDDQEFGQELELVSTLRHLGETHAPDQQTRDRIAGSITDPPQPGRATQREPAQARPSRRERWRRHRPRLGTVCGLACAVLLGLVGLGGAVSASAVPGDPLYQVKRAQEASSLALTFDNEAKAAKHLELATVRLDELDTLPEAREASYRTALTNFDRETRSGVTGMTEVATSSAGDSLDRLRTWTQRQAGRLAAIRQAAPPAAALRAAESEALLERIDTRTSALAARLNCYQMTSGEADDLGDVPASGECASAESSPPAPPRASPTEPPSPAPTERHKPRDPEPTRQPSTGSAIDQVDVTTSAQPTPSRSRAPSRPPIPVPDVPSAVPGPRLPNALPRPPAMVEMPPLMPGLPEIRIGEQ